LHKREKSVPILQGKEAYYVIGKRRGERRFLLRSNRRDKEKNIVRDGRRERATTWILGGKQAKNAEGGKDNWWGDE